MDNLKAETAVLFNRLANEVEALLAEYATILDPGEAVKLGEMKESYRRKAGEIFEEIEIGTFRAFGEDS